MRAGAVICWLLRRHAWRRLRKNELTEGCEQPTDAEAKRHRICSRCSETRLTRQRKPKETES